MVRAGTAVLSPTDFNTEVHVLLPWQYGNLVIWPDDTATYGIRHRYGPNNDRVRETIELINDFNTPPFIDRVFPEVSQYSRRCAPRCKRATNDVPHVSYWCSVSV